jgi:hypothetical protein
MDTRQARTSMESSDMENQDQAKKVGSTDSPSVADTSSREQRMAVLGAIVWLISTSRPRLTWPAVVRDEILADLAIVAMTFRILRAISRRAYGR